MNPQGTTPPPGATPPHGDGASNSHTNANDLPALFNTVNQQELAMVDAMVDAMADVLRSCMEGQEPRLAEAEASAPTDQDPDGFKERVIRLCRAVSSLVDAEQLLRACLLEAVPLDAGREVWRQQAVDAQWRAIAEYEVKYAKVLQTVAEEAVARLPREGAEGELPERRIARD